MELDEVIKFAKQALENVNPDKRVHTEFRLTVEQVKQLLQWLEDYKRLQSVSSWIPCSERMPNEPGTHVMVTDGVHIMESWYELIDGEMLWVDNYTMYVNINFGEVTHWMPLPEPPKEV